MGTKILFVVFSVSVGVVQQMNRRPRHQGARRGRQMEVIGVLVLGNSNIVWKSQDLARCYHMARRGCGKTLGIHRSHHKNFMNSQNSQKPSHKPRSHFSIKKQKDLHFTQFAPNEQMKCDNACDNQ
jgi:hypothetical protein